MSKTKNNIHETSNPTQENSPVQINGFQQVVEMLKIADPAFRDSLLRRLAARDQNLANSLRRDLLK